jgi:predicted nucleic-acid-binding protein
MRAADTNVVARFLLGDDPAQSARANAFFRRENVWIALTVILETEWVLRGVYKFKPQDVTAAFTGLAGMDNVSIENPSALALALDLCGNGLDFADALHVAVANHCDGFDTFDTALAKAAVSAGIDSVTLL